MEEILTNEIMGKAGSKAAMPQIIHGVQQMILGGSLNGNMIGGPNGFNDKVVIQDKNHQQNDHPGRHRSQSADRRRAGSKSRSWC
eukprot:scaffold55354_cov19-Prasinocladus_malaysianus.AAC.1